MSPPHEALGAHRGFARLDAATLQALAACLRPRTYARGDIIFRHGDPGDELFVSWRARSRCSSAGATDGTAR